MAVEQMAKFLGNLNQRFRNILWLKQGKCKLSVLNIEKQKKPLCLEKKKLYGLPLLCVRPLFSVSENLCISRLIWARLMCQFPTAAIKKILTNSVA